MRKIILITGLFFSLNSAANFSHFYSAYKRSKSVHELYYNLALGDPDIKYILVESPAKAALPKLQIISKVHFRLGEGKGKLDMQLLSAKDGSYLINGTLFRASSSAAKDIKNLKLILKNRSKYSFIFDMFFPQANALAPAIYWAALGAIRGGQCYLRRPCREGVKAIYRICLRNSLVRYKCAEKIAEAFEKGFEVYKDIREKYKNRKNKLRQGRTLVRNPGSGVTGGP